MSTAKLIGQQNQCPTCKRFFARSKGFDKHRGGSFGDGPGQTSPNRRCMTDEELEKAYGRFAADGFWRFSGPPTTWTRKRDENAL